MHWVTDDALLFLNPDLKRKIKNKNIYKASKLSVAQGFFRPAGKLFSAADHGVAFEIDFVFVFVVEIVAVAVVVAGVVVVVGIKILRVDTSLSMRIMKENMAVFFPPVMGSPLFAFAVAR